MVNEQKNQKEDPFRRVIISYTDMPDQHYWQMNDGLMVHSGRQYEHALTLERAVESFRTVAPDNVLVRVDHEGEKTKYVCGYTADNLGMGVFSILSPDIGTFENWSSLREAVAKAVLRQIQREKLSEGKLVYDWDFDIKPVNPPSNQLDENNVISLNASGRILRIQFPEKVTQGYKVV
ncbi:MAG: hypothetical protein QS98_C0008G0030 [archaeon GW2011_AR3]|nr:MAG: hypothetical protein QS98_C0008G0030 [archaeon GW2011_AR3]